MLLDVNNEIDAIEKAKKEFNEKLSAYFKDKWVLAIDGGRKKYFYLRDSSPFLKNKDGKFIAFKVENCRPKTAKSTSEKLYHTIVIEGFDSFGKKRSISLIATPTKEGLSVEDTETFESPEEAILYATLKESEYKSRY